MKNYILPIKLVVTILIMALIIVSSFLIKNSYIKVYSIGFEDGSLNVTNNALIYGVMSTIEGDFQLSDGGNSLHLSSDLALTKYSAIKSGEQKNPLKTSFSYSWVNYATIIAELLCIIYLIYTLLHFKKKRKMRTETSFT